jgi:hypothetical protein
VGFALVAAYVAGIYAGGERRDTLATTVGWLTAGFALWALTFTLPACCKHARHRKAPK